jgi:hypothetical protein
VWEYVHLPHVAGPLRARTNAVLRSGVDKGDGQTRSHVENNYCNVIYAIVSGLVYACTCVCVCVCACAPFLSYTQTCTHAACAHTHARIHTLSLSRALALSLFLSHARARARAFSLSEHKSFVGQGAEARKGLTVSYAAVLWCCGGVALCLDECRQSSRKRPTSNTGPSTGAGAAHVCQRASTAQMSRGLQVAWSWPSSALPPRAAWPLSGLMRGRRRRRSCA